MRIGGEAEVREAYSFGAVTGLALHSDGRIFVADGQDHSIRAYSATGELLGTLARRGRGPGETQSPCCLSIDTRGQLWVRDFGNRRYNVYDVTTNPGRVVATITGTPNPAGVLDRVSWNAHGNIIDLGSVVDPSTGAFRLLRLMLDSTGRVVSSAPVPQPPADSVAEILVRSRSGSAVFQVPFGARALYAFGPLGQLVQAVSSRYSIDWRRPDGRRHALLQRTVAGPRLTAEETARAEKALATIAQRSQGAATRPLPAISRSKPPISGLGFDQVGRLWVFLQGENTGTRRADVYRPDGSFEAVYEWPANIRMELLAVREMGGIAIGIDSSGVHSVVKFDFRAR
jgi:hypothetical protein